MITNIEKIGLILMCLVMPSVQGQETAQEMDHSQMHRPTTNETNQDTDRERMYDMQNMNEMMPYNMSMQGGRPPEDARDPHAYSDGYTFGPLPRLRLADEKYFFSIIMDRLEGVITNDNSSITYDLQAKYGRDYNKVVLKAEGDFDSGSLEESRTEILWGHAVTAFWDTQLGLRQDTGEGPNRTWVGAGVQGLAPYWFEIDATAYVNGEGNVALNLESEYELLMTQKLVLQPRLELNVYTKNDPQRELGSGLSDMSIGLRLRYEVRREFAPYLGVEWASKFGNTKDFARSVGIDPDEFRFVAGLRFWF